MTVFTGPVYKACVGHLRRTQVFSSKENPHCADWATHPVTPSSTLCGKVPRNAKKNN